MDRVLNALIMGENIYLRGFEREDLEGEWYKWFNDPYNTRFTSHGKFPNTKEKQTKFFEHITNSPSDLALAMVIKKTHEHVGVIGLHNINWINRNAEVSLMVGKFDKQYSGIGLESMVLIMDHGFRRLGLHKIYAGQDVGLYKWRKTLETIGFKVEGFKKEHVFRDGAFRDVVMIGCFSEDFFKSEVTRKFIKTLPAKIEPPQE
jgi:ribosomal-protein-alanine N-acetyltransferase